MLAILVKIYFIYVLMKQGPQIWSHYVLKNTKLAELETSLKEVQVNRGINHYFFSSENFLM